jgi:hypothetical protein
VTVAVVGASSDRRKFGNKAVRAYLSRGHTVFPVNLSEDRIEGLEVYRKVEDVPVDLDAILVYVPPRVALEVLPGIARKGAGQVFLNPGSEDGTVIARARELGIDPVLACAIVAIGESPSHFS